MKQRDGRYRELPWLPCEKNGVRIYMSLAAKHERTRGGNEVEMGRGRGCTTDGDVVG